jgi:GTP-binding protein HflX
VLLTDTVGFIRKLPHHLVASFRATLEEVREADLLLHVIDASHPSWEEQRLIVDDVLTDLGVRELPMVYVFNKMDALPAEQRSALQERIANLAPGSAFVSALSSAGLDPLRETLREALRARRPEVELLLPITNGKLLAEVHRVGEAVSAVADADEGVMRVRGRFAVADLARFERDGAARA